MKQLKTDIGVEVARLITPRQVAARYQVSDRTISRWVSGGMLPVVRLSQRCLRFDPAKCDEALTRFEQAEITR